MHSSRKYPNPHQGRITETPKGTGVSKAKIVKGKYEAKSEFPGERHGVKWIFFGTT